jgi:hypothetical protein
MVVDNFLKFDDFVLSVFKFVLKDVGVLAEEGRLILELFDLL